MREGWNVIIRYDEEIVGTNIWLIHKQRDQETIVNPINLEMRTFIEPCMELPLPTLRFARETGRQFLQGLAEALVAAGFRPDELKANDKELEAVRYHLEDMRNLVNEALLPAEVIPRLEERR